MSKILELYNSWSRPGVKGGKEKISSPAKYINGKEFSAGGGTTTDFFSVAKTLGAEIDGFKANAQKGDPSAYPLDNEKAMEKARTQETGGTYDFKLNDWNNKYSSTFVRE